MNREIANFFWHGELTRYEYKCIESFVKNNFEVNVWSYGDLNIPDGAVLKDAREILPENHLTKYKQKHFLDDNTKEGNEYSSLAAFSDAFRFTLLNVKGGWWFDCDVFCLKNQLEYKKLKENKNLVVGFQYDPNANVFDCGCAIIYFKDHSISKLFYDELQLRCLQNNYVFSGWANIGPHLIEHIIKKNSLIDEVFPESYFYPITWKDLNYFIDEEKINETKLKTKDSYCIHMWNSQLSQVYKIKNAIPQNSFLKELFNE